MSPDTSKGLRVDAVQRVPRQVKVLEVRDTAKCLQVNGADLIPGKVKHHQELDLIQLGVWYGGDGIAR